MNLISKMIIPKPVMAQTSWSGSCVSNSDVATIQGFNCIFANVAQVIVYFAGIVFFIMFIRGGFSYMTAGGDPKKSAKATSTITMSVIGLIGVIIAFIIIKFINSFTGVDVTNFNIPG